MDIVRVKIIANKMLVCSFVEVVYTPIFSIYKTITSCVLVFQIHVIRMRWATSFLNIVFFQSLELALLRIILLKESISLPLKKGYLIRDLP